MTNTIFTDYLNKFDEKEWLAAIAKIAPSIHEVDRNAVQIWFRFYPLSLHEFLGAAEDKAKAEHQFAIQGEYQLVNQIDSSHRFLYAHRFWTAAKKAVEERAASFNNETADLANEIETLAQNVAGNSKTDKSLTLAIAAVGLMTWRQVGAEAFKNAKGEVIKAHGLMTKTPDQIVAERAKDDSQGVFGFLKTVNKKYTVKFETPKTHGDFRATLSEDIATASGHNQSQNWKQQDERCWEGVVPVECRSAACGTCWIGVLGGEEKLSDVQRLERKQMKIFGYNQSSEAKPYLRLACQAKVSGNVSIVIPPWNGVFGKKVYDNIENIELEPVTTSAAKLRETIATATDGDK